ncbi:MAG: AI-2E family transporter [Burkholderiaceae bacterium]|nr:AI-2E family transporter [Roseateles sp.]MBV8470888.1 AI-2E family transporter [Burkholderiaceae bacterium]
MSLSTAQRYALAWMALAALCAALLWRLAPVLSPFVTAAVLAYALAPAVDRLVRHGMPRLLAVALVELLAVVAAVAVIVLIVPILSHELPLLKAQIPVVIDALNTQVLPWLRQHGLPVTLDGAAIKGLLMKYMNANLEDWLLTTLNSVRVGGSFLLALVGNAVLLPVVLFYLLLDWHSLMNRAWHMVPPRLRAAVGGFLRECDQMLGQYLRGQVLVMLVLALYYSLGLTVGGLDLALPLGVFTGLAVCVPYLGFGLGLSLALLSALLQFGSWYGVLAVGLVYGIGQVLEGFILTPRLVGERIGLSPLTVIFALLAFGQLFGFIGVLVALPVSALLVVAGRRLRGLYLGSALYKAPRP